MAGRWGTGLVCVVLLACAPRAGGHAGRRGGPADGEVHAEAPRRHARHDPGRPPFRVQGRVANAKGRRAQTARLTFSLRTARSSSARRERRLGGKNVKRTKGGRSRALLACGCACRRARGRARYVFFACVRRGSGTLRGSCKSRRLRVTARPATPGTRRAARPARSRPRRRRRPAEPARAAHGRELLLRDGGPVRQRRRGERHGRASPGDRLVHGFDPTHKGFYHGGDLKGMLSKIDYIKGLGTTAIWLTPSFKNKPVQGPSGQETAGYHGYWITDFTQIDPHLGTNADLPRSSRPRTRAG